MSKRGGLQVPITAVLRDALRALRYPDGESGAVVPWAQLAQALPVTGARVRQIVKNDPPTYLVTSELYTALGLEIPQAVNIFMPEGTTLFSETGGVFSVGDIAEIINRQTGERAGIIVYLPEQWSVPIEALLDHAPYLIEQVTECVRCGRKFVMRSPRRQGVPWHRICDVCSGRGRYANGNGHLGEGELSGRSD